MKKEPKILFNKAINSLILSIEFFNRPWDKGRQEAVLIFMDHSFEMLLKSAILYRGGKIREKRAKQTIGFDQCVRKSISDANIKFLSEEQALAIQTINNLRDAAQHYIVDLSEQQLYFHTQMGLSVFRSIAKSVFNYDIAKLLPERILPVSVRPPKDINIFFDNQIDEIKELLKPSGRKYIDAIAKLRGLAILDGAIKGEKLQPSDGELRKIAKQIQSGVDWNKIFTGISSVNFTANGYGPSLDLKITKKEGIPIHIVSSNFENSGVVAIKRVDELSFYNLSHTKLSEHFHITSPKMRAIVLHLKIRDDKDCYKEFPIGKNSVIKRYSQKAIEVIKKELPNLDIKEIWERYKPKWSKNNDTK